jgi:electron transport complex protein RnfG
MSSSIRMLAVLGGIALVSGTSLGALHEATHERAENNILRFKKIPAVVAIQETFAGPIEGEARLALEEELLAERRTLDIGGPTPLLLFVVKRDGEPLAVAMEGAGPGFGGPVGVMVGVNLETEELVGIGITTMSETPGVGTRVLEPTFTAQFAGLGPDANVKVKKDGGEIDAITGATISSRAVATGVEQARTIWAEHRDAIRAAVAAPPATAGGPA